jgi:hypothetical protein
MALVMLRHRRNAAQGDLLHLAGAESHAAAEPAKLGNEGRAH